ncbi:hypothetical protein HQQ80_20280 [Microbacteriaceae bacterium VKM Ac-2855]|nr:hypothetical protein [Microbacteriaceae bacterium VKM Ac-2855]
MKTRTARSDPQYDPIAGRMEIARHVSGDGRSLRIVDTRPGVLGRYGIAVLYNLRIGALVFGLLALVALESVVFNVPVIALLVPNFLVVGALFIICALIVVFRDSTASLASAEFARGLEESTVCTAIAVAIRTPRDLRRRYPRFGVLYCDEDGAIVLDDHGDGAIIGEARWDQLRSLDIVTRGSILRPASIYLRFRGASPDSMAFELGPIEIRDGSPVPIRDPVALARRICAFVA